MHVPEYPDEIGPLSFESELDKDGELEVMWENYYDEIESRWLTREQAIQLIGILSQRFKLGDSRA